MKSFTSLTLLAGLATAAPTFQVSDTSILQYALTLEHLEDTFYSTALSQFGAKDFKAAGLSDDFYNNIKMVASDEKDHVAALTTALADKAVGACTYNFAFKTVNDFLNTAAVLEGVGISAYLGAAGDIQQKAYLAVAGSILTTEARHASYIRGGKPNPEKPFAAPYDVGLDYRQVFTLAAGFITKCPMDLGLTGFPSLTVSMANSYSVGDSITLTPGATANMGSDQLYAGFTIPGKPPMFVAASMSNGGCTIMIPAGAAGQTYVILQSGSTMPTMFDDNCVVAGPAIIEVS